MTVSTLLATSTSRELTEWMIFFQIEAEDADADQKAEAEQTEKERVSSMAGRVQDGFATYMEKQT